MKISIIVAIARNGGIGKDGGLLCHLPADLKHFKQITTGHTIIMGRRTYESLPNGALPNRRNIVLTRNKNVEYKDAELYASLQDALSACQQSQDDEVFIIGGSSVYDAAMPVADRMYLTSIEIEGKDADTFFPDFDPTEWDTTEMESHEADERNHCAYTFLTLTRRK